MSSDAIHRAILFVDPSTARLAGHPIGALPNRALRPI
jgi:hypothetical protein